MRKAAQAIVAEVAKAEAKPPPNVILTFFECYRRVQTALGERGRTAVAIEPPRRVHWEARPFTVFDVELRDGGKVKVVDLETLARELNLIDDCEKPLGVGWPEGTI
jgi:hypothetical protein